MALAITLQEYLDHEDVDYELLTHSYAGNSMLCAEAAHISGEQLAKSVVLRDGKGYLLAVVPATHRLQLNKLQEALHRPLELAEEHELDELFNDCDVGAVPPLGRAYGLNVVVDERLAEQEDIYFEAGDHTDLVHVSGRNFRSLMKDARHGRFSRHL